MKTLNTLLIGIFFLNSVSHEAFAVTDGVMVPGPGQGVSRETGRVYYTTVKEGEVLIKTNFWGAVTTPGIHYLPDGTDIVTGLSMAGGPIPDAIMDDVKIIRASGKMIKLNLDEAQNLRRKKFKLRPGDVIHLKKSHFWERLPLWMGAAGLLLSSVSVYLAVKADADN